MGREGTLLFWWCNSKKSTLCERLYARKELSGFKCHLKVSVVKLISFARQFWLWSLMVMLEESSLCGHQVIFRQENV